MEYNPVVITKKGHKQIRSQQGHIMMTYLNIPRNLQFKHPMVNDHNQDLCGGWYIRPTTEFEEVDRVCLGLKPVGLSGSRDLDRVKEKAREILKKGYLATYGNYSKYAPDYYFITASVTGKLKDVFDMKTLAEDYKRNGLYDGNIHDYAEANFARFHHFKFDVKDHPIEIVGLILGYPIENTISLIKRDL